MTWRRWWDEAVLQVLRLFDGKQCPLVREAEEMISEAAAKSPNRCHDFAYNPMDAFQENEKGYLPQKPGKGQCDGQMKLF